MSRFAIIPLNIALRLHSMSAAAAGLYAVLRTYHNERTGLCNPSSKTIIEEFERAGFPMPRSTFFKARQELLGLKVLNEETGELSPKLIELDDDNYVFLEPVSLENETDLKSQKRDSRLPSLENETISESQKRDSESRKRDSKSQKRDSLLHVTDHEQTNNKKGGNACARGELTDIQIALLRVLGWGLTPPDIRYNQILAVEEEMAQIVRDYGQDYAPTPERIARFPDFARASQFSRWGTAALMNNWKRAVDWMNSVAPRNGNTKHKATPADTQAWQSLEVEQQRRQAIEQRLQALPPREFKPLQDAVVTELTRSLGRDKLALWDQQTLRDYVIAQLVKRELESQPMETTR